MSFLPNLVQPTLLNRGAMIFWAVQGLLTGALMGRVEKWKRKMCRFWSLLPLFLMWLFLALISPGLISDLLHRAEGRTVLVIGIAVLVATIMFGAFLTWPRKGA